MVGLSLASLIQHSCMQGRFRKGKERFPHLVSYMSCAVACSQGRQPLHA